MLYKAYQLQKDMAAPLRLLAQTLGDLWSAPPPQLADNTTLRRMAAACQIMAWGGLTHRRPEFGIATVIVGNRELAIREETVHLTPFASLVHFKKVSEFKRDRAADQPKILVVAPLSGHFATLLRGTVRTLLPDHDVYITDWHNARDVPLRAGDFGLDAFIEHVIEFLAVLGPGAHVMAICQPSVAALAAVAVMAEDGHPCVPSSMTLMAGPIDCRINPTGVNEFATSHSIGWFEKNLIDMVPSRFPGAARRVYPGFLQLTGFMTMNLERHMKAFKELHDLLAAGETEKAKIIQDFYDEYFAVMDLSAEFYLETVRLVFQDYALPLGQLTLRGRRIDPGAITKTTLLTVEGERDDICSIGQTLAAQDLCTGLPPYMKRHYVQTGVGHYGVFSGRRWNNEIYPIVRDVVHGSAVS
jgi:poly(3-hydroxybutyrate) depolymerase